MGIIPFLTFENQVRKIEDKNIIIDDDKKCIENLKNHSYYSLINGYKRFFLDNTESDKMIEHTNFNHFIQCKLLDIDIHSILFKYIQIVEQGFRTRLAYIIAREFGTDDTQYVSLENYNNTNKREQVINSMKSVINAPHKSSYSFYFKKIKKPIASIPPWILLQDIEFNTVIQLYEILPDNLRKEIRSQYIELNENYHRENPHFIKALHFIREYRNIFAHSKRNFSEKMSHSVHKKILLQKFNVSFIEQLHFTNNYSKSLAAIILLMLSFLNDDSLKSRLVMELYHLIISFGYVENEINLTGKKIFNGQTIYDLLDLPTNFFTYLAEWVPDIIPLPFNRI